MALSEYKDPEVTRTLVRYIKERPEDAGLTYAIPGLKKRQEDAEARQLLSDILTKKFIIHNDDEYGISAHGRSHAAEALATYGKNEDSKNAFLLGLKDEYGYVKEECIKGLEPYVDDPQIEAILLDELEDKNYKLVVASARVLKKKKSEKITKALIAAFLRMNHENAYDACRAIFFLLTERKNDEKVKRAFAEFYKTSNDEWLKEFAKDKF